MNKISDAPGAVFVADLLATLPANARNAAQQVIARHSKVIMYLPSGEAAERAAFAQTLRDAKLKKREIVLRLMTRFGIKERCAYATIERLNPTQKT